ncbi:hypothetical protein ACHQM5_001563 [Ranunculus cassubicifolius]
MAIETTNSSSAPTIVPSSSPTSTTTTTTITSTTPHITSIHHLISVKLDHHNYLLWLAQFKPLLKGYGLEGFVDGSHPCPPRLLNPTDTDINPSYTQWQQQDQILLGWLLSSLTDPILAQVAGISTSSEVWVALERQYASKSRARIMQLRRELQTIRKGSQTMQQYFLKAKQLADSLASSGHPIQPSDLQQIILAGLDSAYDAIVTTLTTTVVDTSMDDFYAHLLAFDMRVEAQTAALHQIPVANVATQQRHTNSRSYTSLSSQPPRSYPHQSGNRNQNTNRNRNRSNATMSRPNPNTSVPCQICGLSNLWA